MAKKSESVYRIIDVVGVSEKSWEDAGRIAVETAAGSLRDLRVAEVTKMDMKVDDGKVTLSAPGWRSRSNTRRDPASSANFQTGASDRLNCLRPRPCGRGIDRSCGSATDSPARWKPSNWELCRALRACGRRAAPRGHDVVGLSIST